MPVRLTLAVDEPIQVTCLKRFSKEARSMFELIVNQDFVQRRVQKQFGTEPADRPAAEGAGRSARRPAVAARALRVLAAARSTLWAFAYRSRRQATELR
jgi:hypothetical protein